MIRILSKSKNIIYAIILLIISLIFFFGIGEILLRVFYPKYEYAVESKVKGSVNRIWKRDKNTCYKIRHPDNGQFHFVHHNNLALRQNRDFLEQDIKSAINIGFFGDSYTENVGLPSQYSFTEPLDYLLNNTGTSEFNVLNFGVGGYGMDQELLYYLDFEYSKNLDYVFYMFCPNDLRNIYENNLFSINEKKEVVQNKARDSSWQVKFIRRFHLTYLIIDVLQRLRLISNGTVNTKDDEFGQKKEHMKRFHDKRANALHRAFTYGKKSQDLEDSIKIFQALLHMWKQEVENNGGKFFIVLLPGPKNQNARNLFSNEYDVIDLYQKFKTDIGNYNYRDFSFKSDRHWNEAANQLASKYLYRVLEEELKLPSISIDKLKEEFFTYYSSFEGWMPKALFIKEIGVSLERKQRIKSKYDHLNKARGE